MLNIRNNEKIQPQRERRINYCLAIINLVNGVHNILPRKTGARYQTA